MYKISTNYILKEQKALNESLNSISLIFKKIIIITIMSLQV